MLEDAAYRRMLDVYYATEKPLPKVQQAIYRLVRARSHAERLAVDVVLGEFFMEGVDGWRNARADIEIAKAKEKGSKAKASADKRWQSEGNADAMRTHSEGNADAMRTHSEGNAPNNQEPKAKREEAPQRSRGSRLTLPDLPADWRSWCERERPDLNPSSVWAAFRDYWTAKAGKDAVKLDWQATWRNWVRNEKRRPGGSRPGELKLAI